MTAAPAFGAISTRAREVARYPRRLPALTSMRFFAAAWVVAMHFSWWLPGKGDNLPLLSRGGMAVDFFFMLSGFVLAHAHHEAIVTHQLKARVFLIRRLARIYPMHLATIGFYVVMIGAAAVLAMPLPNPERYGVWQLILNVTLLHALQAHDAGAWNYPSWSISAEWIAYLLFPMIARPLLADRLPVGVKAAGCSVLVILAWSISPVLLGSSFFHLHSNFGWFRILPEFALGIALYEYGRVTAMPALASSLTIAALVVLLGVLAWFELEVAMLVPLALLVLSGAELARAGSGTLASPVLVYAGDASYALYMVHLPVATVVLRGVRGAGGMTPLWALPVAGLLAVALALFAHRLVEAPGSRLIMRLLSRSRL